MKIGFLFAGVIVVGLQLITESLGDMIFVTQLSLFAIGSVLIAEGLAVEPKFGYLEERINELKTEILDLKYPLQQYNDPREPQNGN